MYITICEIDRQSRFVHWDDPKGWDGEGGGTGVQDGADSCQRMAEPLQYCEVISLQLKFKKKKRM